MKGLGRKRKKAPNDYPLPLEGRAFFWYGILVLCVLLLSSHEWLSNPHLLLAALTQGEITERINAERKDVGLEHLRRSAKLQLAAQNKADDMIERGYFSHVGPEDEKPWVWIQEAGYSYSRAAETLALDVADSGALVRTWLASPPHAKVLRNGAFTDIGIGIAEGDLRGEYTRVAVAFLASANQGARDEGVSQNLRTEEASSMSALSSQTSLAESPAEKPVAILVHNDGKTREGELEEVILAQEDAPREQFSHIPEEAGLFSLSLVSGARLLLTAGFLLLGIWAVFFGISSRKKARFFLSRLGGSAVLLAGVWSTHIMRLFYF